MTIVMLTSFYLLSELGVEGDPNMMVTLIGASGLVCIILTALICMIMLNRAQHEHEHRQSRELSYNHRESATSNIEDDTLALAMI